MFIPSLRGGAIILGLVVTAAAATSGMANPASDAVQCGVLKSKQGNMLVLQGNLSSSQALNGDYRLTIRSSGNGGSSNISQGGYFNAKANEVTTLGQVTVNAGSNYNLAFDVTANGKTVDCSQEYSHKL